MRRAILIHGYGGRPDEGWFLQLRRELERQGFRVFAPAMPDTMHPRADAWVRTVADLVGVPDQETILIGFSLGCITILRYLEGLAEGEDVGAAILIAGFARDLGPDFAELSSFVDREVDWERVRARSRHFAVFHGDDDSLVPLSEGEELSRRLGAPLHIESGVGHFNTARAPVIVPLVADAIRNIQ